MKLVHNLCLLFVHQGTHLFIVLDTNILLSHLKFVRELMDSPIPGIVDFALEFLLARKGLLSDVYSLFSFL